MENLQQLVVQINNVPEIRTIVQYGTDFLPNSQKIVKYEELTIEEKVIWDNFIDLMVNK
jgi:hypothetical protein